MYIKFISLLALTVIQGVEFMARADSPEPIPVMEGFPDDYIQRLKLRDEHVRSLKSRHPVESVFSVIHRLNAWIPGTTITVAFDSGNLDLHRKIESVARIWERHGNFRFDFGYNVGTKKYRSWSATDPAYVANVRISFRHKNDWCLLGQTSMDPLVAGPGQASMNFEIFDLILPDDWEATVLHEFGHALGFAHEHQNPNAGCDGEFRWEDDDQGAGIYTLLAAKPNEWPKSKVDENLRQIPNPVEYRISAHDTNSIMHYAYQPWMFRNADRSHCFIKRATQISALDSAGVAEAYPAGAPFISRVIRQRQNDLSALLKLTGLPGSMRTTYSNQMNSLLTK